MKLTRSFALPMVILSLVASPVASAGENSKDPWGNERDSIPAELASPWTQAKPWLLGGAFVTAALVILREPVSEPIARHFADRQTLGEFARYGYYSGLGIQNAAYALGMLTYAMFEHDNRAYLRGMGMAKTTLYASGSTALIKLTSRAQRPDASDRYSFPSGHATAAFAFSSYIVAEHGWVWGTAATALSAFVGLSRMNDRKHYLHDVVGGAAIGTIWAVAIHKTHTQAEQPRAIDKDQYEKSSSNGVQFMPVLSLETWGLVAALDF